MIFDNHIIKELVHMRRDFFWEEYESFESYSVIIFVIHSKLKHIRNHSRIILSKYAIYYYYVFKRQTKIMTPLVVKDCNDVEWVYILIVRLKMSHPDNK